MLHSVRAYLLTLVAICIILATSAFAFIASGAIEAGRKQAENQTLETARVLSQGVDRELEHAIGVLTALRQSRAANGREWAVLDRQARSSVTRTDAWIVVQDRSGQQLVNTRLPSGSILPKAAPPDRMWQELDNSQERVCNLVEGPVERRIVCVDVGIGSGRPQFAISMIFQPKFFDTIVRREGVSEGSIATLVDRNAAVVWRYPGGDRYVGKQATGAMLEALRARQQTGVLESTTFDGVRVLSAFQRSALSGWSVVVGTPMDELSMSASTTIIRGSAVALLVLAIGCALAVLVASKLVQAMNTLSRAATNSSSDGTFKQTGIREIDEAGAALKRAAVADEQVRATETKYRRIFEQTSDLLITADLEQVITGANPAAAAAVGLEDSELIDQRISDFVSPEDYQKTSSMLRQKLEHGGDTKYDVRVRHRSGEWLFWEINSGLTHNDAGEPVGLHIVARDVTERKRAERQNQVLIGELNHRVKNTLAVVQSLAHQTFREGSTMPAQKDAFEGRLRALAAAHNILTRQHWEFASMGEIVRNSMSAFCRDEHCTVEGPDFRLSARAAVNFSLAVHELATNAVKYGALSSPEGRVHVQWQREGDSFVFQWRETGGPKVKKPTKRGFGTRLIERTLAAELGGRVEIEFNQTGLICRVSTDDARVMDAKESSMDTAV